MKQSEQDVIDYFDEEAEVEIGSAQEFTDLAKDLRRHQAAVLGLAAERDDLVARLAEAVGALELIAEASEHWGREDAAERWHADAIAYAHLTTSRLARATLASIKETRGD